MIEKWGVNVLEPDLLERGWNIGKDSKRAGMRQAVGAMLHRHRLWLRILGLLGAEIERDELSAGSSTDLCPWSILALHFCHRMGNRW